MGIEKIAQNQHDKTKKKVKLEEINFQEWREQNSLSIKGEDCDSEDFNPYMTFQEVPVLEEIKGYTNTLKKPTPIQSQSWPILLNKRDSISIAETGSGKTLAFLIPAFQHIFNKTKNMQNPKYPTVMVVAPTRELAQQISAVSHDAGKFCGIKSICLYGGVNKYEQIKALKQKVHIIIGTPGRLRDLIEQEHFSAKKISMMILDEADRMLDAGFEPQISYLYEQIRPKKQSVMFSATWPQEVQKFAKKFLINPITTKIGTDEGSANKNVQQIVELCQEHQKQGKLLNLLKQNCNQTDNKKIIVFALYKKEAERVEQYVNNNGFKCVSIHGDKSQIQRDQAFDSFKKGESLILVATDVAARGLDIKNVDLVINYTFPLTVSDYVHRIGRTGRAGAKGISVTFFTENEKKLAGDLCDILKEANQIIPPEIEKFGPSMQKNKQHAMYGDFYKNVDESIKPVKTKLC